MLVIRSSKEWWQYRLLQKWFSLVFYRGRRDGHVHPQWVVAGVLDLGFETSAPIGS